MKISFVIPCYRSADTIEGVWEEIRDAMKARPGIDYEVILVNDNSPDQTSDVIFRLAEEHDAIRAVDLAKNSGQPSAILAGMSLVSGDYVMTSDDDGQTPIDRVFDFLDEMERGDYDVVCARYTERDQPSLFRRFGSGMNRKVADYMIDKPKGVYMATIFLARRFVADRLAEYRKPYPYMAALLLRITRNIGNVSVPQRKRAAGSSGYTFSKLLKLWMNGFTSNPTKPIALAAKTGAAFFFVSFVLFLVFLIRLIIGSDGGNAAWILASCIFFTQSIVLFFLALIGEVVGRSYVCISDVPQYVIRRDSENEKRKDTEGENV